MQLFSSKDKRKSPYLTRLENYQLQDLTGHVGCDPHRHMAIVLAVTIRLLCDRLLVLMLWVLALVLSVNRNNIG